jgi:hypothetical protein
MDSSDNIKYLCRLCGSKTISHTRLNIFDSDSESLNINTKITNCIGIIISENDYLPKVLCSDCVSNVENFNRFKIESLRITAMLLELFNKSTSNSNKVLPESPINNILEPEIQIETDDSKLNLVPVKRKSSIKTKKVLTKKKRSVNTIEISGFPCNHCDAHFASYIESIKHVRLVHKKVSKNKSTLSSKNVKNNDVEKVKKERKQYKKRPKQILKCHFCDKQYERKSKLVVHIQSHIYEPLPCSYCNKIFKRYNDLKYHIKRHEKAYDHICYYCGKGFIGKTAFEIHVRTKHTKEFPYECDKCEKKFASKFALKNHDLIVHTNNNTFICEICGKSFKNPYYLKQHKRSHEIPMEERKKFKCTLCDAAFINRKGVKRHMLVHTGELPYECTLCEKRYKDKRGLKTHSLVHSGERNFVCIVCGKAFALKFNLDVHQKIHTGERPYQCNVCLKTFTQNSSLNLHRKKSCHGIQHEPLPMAAIL